MLPIAKMRGLYFDANKKRYGTTVHKMANYWMKKFKQEEIPEPESSVQNIVGHVVGTKKIQSRHLNKIMNFQQIEKVNNLCECRLARMPVQYIIGEWDFRDITLKIIPPVFIPRPETEMLVDIVIKNTDKLDTMLEIGCGTGAISISLLRTIPHLKGVAVDLSKEACQLTRTNADSYILGDRITVLNKKLLDDGTIDGIEGIEFDVIVSNPPYVYTSEIHELEPEIKLYEDVRALDGGIDGLRLIKALLTLSSRILAPNKSLFLEVHHKHLDPIVKYLSSNPQLKLSVIKSFKDFANYDRFIQIQKL